MCAPVSYKNKMGLCLTLFWSQNPDGPFVKHRLCIWKIHPYGQIFDQSVLQVK